MFQKVALQFKFCDFSLATDRGLFFSEHAYYWICFPDHTREYTQEAGCRFLALRVLPFFPISSPSLAVEVLPRYSGCCWRERFLQNCSVRTRGPVMAYSSPFPQLERFPPDSVHALSPWLRGSADKISLPISVALKTCFFVFFSYGVLECPLRRVRLMQILSCLLLFAHISTFQIFPNDGQEGWVRFVVSIVHTKVCLPTTKCTGAGDSSGISWHIFLGTATTTGAFCYG